MEEQANVTCTQTDEQRDAELFARIEIVNRPHFDECVAFAKKVNKWTGQSGLRTNLERLVTMAGNKSWLPPGETPRRLKLYKDFAPYSFEFSMSGLAGGLIFHGNHDGGGNGSAPTFSVSLTPVDGWSIHT